MLDILGFFGTLDYTLGETTEADRDFQRLIRKYFIHFAKEGKNHCQGCCPLAAIGQHNAQNLVRCTSCVVSQHSQLQWFTEIET